MKNLRKAVAVMAVTLVAAVALLTIKPIRAWASAEGSWLYNQFTLQGPAYIFKSRIGGAQGIRISTGAYSGASQLGVPTAPTGTTDLILEGGQTSTAFPGTAEGHVAWDSTVHSLVFFDGTVRHKLVYTAATGADIWTSY